MNKPPSEIAAELCRARGGSFFAELEAYLMTGYVFSTPELFLMGKPVPIGVDLSDPWESWPLDECGAWYVWVGVGPAAKLLRMMPFRLPWIGWVRQGRNWQNPHWIRLERFESAVVNSAGTWYTGTPYGRLSQSTKTERLPKEG